MTKRSLQTKLMHLQLATMLLFVAGAAIFCWRMIMVDQAIEAHFETSRKMASLRHAGDLLDAVATGRRAEAEELRARMREEFAAVTLPDGRTSSLIHAADKALTEQMLTRAGVVAVRAEVANAVEELDSEMDATEAAYRAQLGWAGFAWSIILVLPLLLAFFPLRLSAGVIAGIQQLGRKVAAGRETGDSTGIIIARDDEIGALGRAIDETFAILKRRESEAAMARQLHTEQQRLTDIVSLTGGIAHEIANPLAVMLANLDLFEETSPQVANIRDGLERIEAVLRDVTAFTSGDEHMDAVDVNGVVGSVFRMIRLDDRLRNVHFTANLAPEVPAVPFSRAVLTLSLFSLMSHAAAIIRDAKGAMVVSTGVEGDDVWVAIWASRNGTPCQRSPNPTLGLESPELHSTLNSTSRVLKSVGGELMVLTMDGELVEYRLRIPSVTACLGAA